MTYAENGTHHHYVSVIDGPRRGLLLGPYRTRKEAEGNVERARVAAVGIDPGLHFAGFGTARVTTTRPPDGALNARLGLTPAAEGRAA